MELVKRKVFKDNREYTDLFLVWTYENKSFAIRIEPCFARGANSLYARAKTIPNDVRMSDYIKGLVQNGQE